jgi:nitrogen-specific signal transduction histidine kinase
MHSENQEALGGLPALVDNAVMAVSSGLNLAKPNGSLSRESLGLLLSCQLAELHGGQISIQGSPESGYRYVLSLPLQMATAETISDV